MSLPLIKTLVIERAKEVNGHIKLVIARVVSPEPYIDNNTIFYFLSSLAYIT